MSKKSGVHQAEIIEFDGRCGTARVTDLDNRIVKIHRKFMRHIRGSWISDEAYRGDTQLLIGSRLQIVLIIGHSGWARVWGLSADYQPSEAAKRIKSHSNRVAPWHQTRQSQCVGMRA